MKFLAFLSLILAPPAHAVRAADILPATLYCRVLDEYDLTRPSGVITLRFNLTSPLDRGGTLMRVSIPRSPNDGNYNMRAIEVEAYRKAIEKDGSGTLALYAIQTEALATSLELEITRGRGGVNAYFASGTVSLNRVDTETLEVTCSSTYPID